MLHVDADPIKIEWLQTYKEFVNGFAKNKIKPKEFEH